MIHRVYSYRGVPMFLLNLFSLAFLIETRNKWISSSGISCMSEYNAMFRMRKEMFGNRCEFMIDRASKFVEFA